MSRSDLLEFSDMQPPVADLQQLPMHVLPQSAEALPSWSGRLGAKLEVSLPELVREGFGLEQRIRPDWWVRPSHEILDHIAARSGLQVEQIQRMTLCDWAANERDDEAGGRFSGWRYFSAPTKERQRGLAVCTDCLRADTVPYLRLSWLIGWVSVCVIHGTALLARCRACRKPLRIPRLTEGGAIRLTCCERCHSDYRAVESWSVPPRLAALHERLLHAKRTGVTDVPGIGSISWSELVMLIDVLLTTVWRQMRWEELKRFLEHVSRVTGLGPGGEAAFLRERLGSLALIAWLLEEWPENLAVAGLGKLATEWINGRRQRPRSEIGPSRDEARHSRLPQWLSAKSGRA